MPVGGMMLQDVTLKNDYLLGLCCPCFFLPGFAQERQFQLNPVDDMFGNRVTLVSNTLSVPCDVERDSTHSNQIMCYTRYSPGIL